MGTPKKTDERPRESLDMLLHRLANMVSGKDERTPADSHGSTVEESVRRLEGGIPPDDGG